ncbi:hypothetical protein GQX73_g522 [Xylaria multiplex]|uniref:Uncharacterized protein n=1 Tax=Xylaria multiplex TaxID=323545 RepID=A0A7C8NBI2_9PEZI|nr:hypothetical protein GQX73_g522 [Xylaria multiplex]
MCIKSYHHFTKCDHVDTVLTKCPTFHKHQASANGLFGCLFRRGARKMKNCGKVVPHHLQNQTYCQACTVKRERFRARELGQGALEVHRQGFQDVFQGERKEAARTSLHKSKKHQRRSKDSNHDIIHVESSVWLANLYDHPETLAKKEAYAREAARAPTVAPRQTRNHRQGVEASPRGSTGKRHRGETRKPESRGEWELAYGHPQPIIRLAEPASTYQYSGRFANNSPGIPPAVGAPPRPQQNDRSFAARAQATGRPDSRYKPAHVHNSEVNHYRYKQPATPYLDRATAEAALQERQVQQHREPTREHVGHWRRDVTRWETRKAAISDFIERAKDKASFSDESSDLSFVCKTSKEISDRESRSTSARRGHRK